MKLLLLSALCFFSVLAFGQIPNNKNPWTNQIPDSLKNFKANNRDALREQLQHDIQRKKLQNNLLANSQGNVIILPLDNMPCIVPDTNSVAKMPNAWKGTSIPYVPQYHPIPNPALPKTQSFKHDTLDNSFSIPTK
jgi:hypothetical protein